MTQIQMWALDEDDIVLEYFSEIRLNSLSLKKDLCSKG